MQLANLLRNLNISNIEKSLELLSPHWQESVQTLPQSWDLLQETHWRENRQWTGCEERCDAALAHFVELVKSQRELYLLAWHCHRLVFEISEYTRHREWDAIAPLLENVEKGLSGAFFLWLAIGAAPRLRQRNKEHNIPDEITKATLWDIGIVQRRFARYNKGEIGVSAPLLRWHRLVASGDLHRVGRFEYIARPFRDRVRVFRNRQTRQVLALSEPDIGYTESGFVPYNGEKSTWASSLLTTKSTFMGNPISPRGFAKREMVELRRKDWQIALKPGDTVLEIHIPEGESLSIESGLQSFKEAISFFARHFPQHNPHSFACYSWLFNTQFEDLFPPSSNIVKWQREVYLFPMPSTGKDGLYFIFGEDEIDVSTAPRDSNLRRVIIEHLQAGNKLRNGAMFFLFEDLDKYGKQFYRKYER